MPFGALFPLTTRSVFPSAGASAGVGTSQPQTHAPALGITTLESLPPELLQCLVELLPRNGTLALCASSKTLRDTLAEARRPHVVAERIRWVCTVTSLEDAVAQVNQCLGRHRAPLIRSLMRQSRHIPALLQPRARQAQLKLDPAPTEAQFLHCALDQWDDQPREAGPPVRITPPMPSLQDILAVPGQEQAGLLLRWMAIKDNAATMSLDQWRSLTGSLSEAERHQALAALVMATDDSRADWSDILHAAWGTARALAANAGGPPPACGALFRALAHALQKYTSHEDATTAMRQSLWDGMLDMVATLPPSDQRTVLPAMAGFLSFQACSSIPATPERCEGLIDTAFRLLPARDVAAVLCAITVDPFDSDVDTWMRPLTLTVLKHAQRLPDESCATVLVAVTLNGPVMDETFYAPLWATVFDASALAGPAEQAPIAAALGERMRRTLEDEQTPTPACHARWLAVFQRTTALPDDLQTAPLAALASGLDCVTRTAEAAAMLLQAAARLPAEHGAAVLASLILSEGCWREPRLWRDMVNMAAALPVVARAAPARALQTKLLHLAVSANFKTADNIPRPTPGPSDMAFAGWPTDMADLVKKMSDILLLLPLRQRAELLIALANELASGSFKVTLIAWILHEAARLPAGGGHESAIVATVCAYAAARCPATDFNAFLKRALASVDRLDPAYRASPLHSLDALVTRLTPDDAARAGIVARIAALPAPDQVVQTPLNGNPLKR
jgi:hypothetical protein